MNTRFLSQAVILGFLVTCLCRADVPRAKEPIVSVLASGSFALWPVPNANLDLDLRKTVAQEYPNRLAFLRVIDSQLQQALSAYQTAVPPKAEDLRGLLSTPEWELFKDLATLIAQAREEAISRSVPIDLNALIGRLSAHPQLMDVNYLIIPYGLTGGRGIGSAGGSTWMAIVPAGLPGSAGRPHTLSGGGSSGVASTMFLRVFVLDMKVRRLVMEGRISASASSSFMKVAALHELEERLGKNLLAALLKPS